MLSRRFQTYVQQWRVPGAFLYHSNKTLEYMPILTVAVGLQANSSRCHDPNLWPENTEAISGRCSCPLEALQDRYVSRVGMYVPLEERTLSHSSHALPAPNPRPAHTGNDLRLKSNTEKITPNDAPRVLLMSRVLRQWSHYSK